MMTPFRLMFVSMLATVMSVAQQQTVDVAEIADYVQPAVVSISSFDAAGDQISLGSGVFLTTEDGLILTNAHVIRNAFSAEVKSDFGTFNQVSIIAIDEDKDLALCRVNANKTHALQLETSRSVIVGEHVVAVGNPLGLEKSVSDGIVSGIRRDEGRELIQTSVPISPGSSGGVLVNSDAKIIGITTSTLTGGQNLNFAVSVRTIQAFIKDVANNSSEQKSLKIARTSVWYRVLLKWVWVVLGGLLAGVFSGNPLSVFLAIIGITAIYWLFTGLWKVLSWPFRRHSNEVVPPFHLGTGKPGDLPEDWFETDKPSSESTTETFFCWKCGGENYFPANSEIVSIRCFECGTKLQIPVPE